MRCRPCQCRSEEHTSELQSRVDISYAVFCLKKNKKKRALRLAGCRARGHVAPELAWRVGVGVRPRWLRESSARIAECEAWRWLCFFLMMRRPPRSPLFPSPTLFRSVFAQPHLIGGDPGEAGPLIHSNGTGPAVRVRLEPDLLEPGRGGEPADVGQHGRGDATA